MKIFNWVQRKLHQNVKDGLGKSGKKMESSEIENNTKAILEQVGLVDVLENWVDGVLTIGTFGFDTLKSSDDHQRDDGSDENESVDLDNVAGDDDDDVDNNINRRDEEMDPLISDKFEYIQNDDVDDLGFGIIDSDLIRAVDCTDLAPALDVDQLQAHKRRTTLAELFMEDTDYTGQVDKSSLANMKSDYGKYKLNGSKSHLSSFAKKIMSRGGKDQDSRRPIKKVHQMMKRMLKRKIHPDIDVGKLCKSDGQNKPTKKVEAVESIHLLNINPDSMA